MPKVVLEIMAMEELSEAIKLYRAKRETQTYDEIEMRMSQKFADELMEMIERQVTVKEQEQKQGKWEKITGMAPPEYHGHRICSVCGCFAPYSPLRVGREVLSRYCPGCGAKMEVEGDAEGDPGRGDAAGGGGAEG